MKQIKQVLFRNICHEFDGELDHSLQLDIRYKLISDVWREVGEGIFQLKDKFFLDNPIVNHIFVI